MHECYQTRKKGSLLVSPKCFVYMCPLWALEHNLERFVSIFVQVVQSFFGKSLTPLLNFGAFQQNGESFVSDMRLSKKPKFFKNLGVKIGLICVQTVKKFRRKDGFVEELAEV
jgi:hypothetical protein